MLYLPNTDGSSGGTGVQYRNRGGSGSQGAAQKNWDPINLYDCISEFFKTDTLDV